MTRDVARFAPVAALLVLSPVSAEYLAAYDSTTGDPAQLLFGLLFLVPLYGCPALIIREVARRTGMTWVGILALAGALGILQAGLIDQSLFRTEYREIPEWAEWAMPTYVESLGFSVYLAMSFVLGHMIWSFGVPIALAEALFPERRRQTWLRKPGLAAASVLYLAAAGLIFADHIATQSAGATWPQAVVAALVVMVLVMCAFTLGRHNLPMRPGRSPRPWLVGLLAIVFGLGHQLFPVSWLGVAMNVVSVVAAALALLWISGRESWTARHELAVAGGLLVARAMIGFIGQPLLGNVSSAEKHGHNIVFGVGVVLLIALAARRTGSQVISSSFSRTA